MGSVEWPEDEFGPLFEAAQGPGHRYASLGVLDKAGDQWTLVDDCRVLFPPLTSLVGLFAVGGDGQEAMPGRRCPSCSASPPRCPAVASGSRPMATASSPDRWPKPRAPRITA